MERASVREEAPSFPRMEATWNLTVCSEIFRRGRSSGFPGRPDDNAILIESHLTLRGENVLVVWPENRARELGVFRGSRQKSDGAKGAKA
jgi:hypothetical protein